MRFASLGSGSRGNATLIACGATYVLLDCGFTLKEVLPRLARFGVAPEMLSAIVVTHEHGDHVRGVAALARQYAIPVWMTPGTRRALGASVAKLTTLHLFNGHARFALGDIEVEPFPVPHDAYEPCQFVFSNGDRRIGVLTDVGSLTPHIEQVLTRCDALILECNHDRDMLRESHYPESLKQRIGGKLGHLNNDASAELLTRVDTSRLQHIVAAHLSEKNNTPYLARTALSNALACAASWIQIADQDAGLGWRQLA